MIEVSNIETYGWKAAIRGMRNSYNSWDKSDTIFNSIELKDKKTVSALYDKIGDNDISLMQRLYKAGPSHRKYLRYIHVNMDINAPLYWWKEYDTYKIGTVANSTSTMHKLMDHKFTLDDFSHDKLEDKIYEYTYNPAKINEVDPLDSLKRTITDLNTLRDLYLEESDKDKKKVLWYEMIQLLPSSYNQLRTVDFNYEVVYTMISQRSGHKLTEWNRFVNILKELPFVRGIGGLD